MRLTCSACGAHGSIEQFTADADARRAIELVAKLPGVLQPVVLRYLGLFRPAKRGLTWDRVCALLGEIGEMVGAGKVERYGIAYAASPALFASAMSQMLEQRERLQLPLKTHGYLVTIISGDSPREAAELERKAEEDKRRDSMKRSAPIETTEQRIARMRQQQEESDRKFGPGGVAGLIKRVDA